jgi:hypothetical protein
MVQIYTGELRIGKGAQENTFMVSKNYRNEKVAELPSALADEDSLRDGLRKWVTGRLRFASIGASTEAGGGGATVRVITGRYVGGAEWRVKWWFTPDQGWALRRAEVRGRTGELLYVCDTAEQDDSSGAFYPKRGRRVSYIEGKPAETVDFETLSLETSAGAIPDSLFQVEFPKQAVIWDQDTKAVIRNTAGTESALNDLVSRAEPPKRSWQWWLLSGASLACAGAFAWALVRRRARRIGTET